MYKLFYLQYTSFLFSIIYFTSAKLSLVPTVSWASGLDKVSVGVEDEGGSVQSVSCLF